MKFLKDGNWGLKLLALVLALVIYHALKQESGATPTNHDRQIIHSR